MIEIYSRNTQVLQQHKNQSNILQHIHYSSYIDSSAQNTTVDEASFKREVY